MNNQEQIQQNTQDSRDNVQGTQQKEEAVRQEDVREEVMAKQKKSVPHTIVEEQSVNLIPVMSREEIKDEERKKKMNKGSLISLSILFSISIVVIGFNSVSRLRLNSQKDKLFAYEKELTGYREKIIQNNEIVERISFYNGIQKGRYSTKEVIDYMQSILYKTGNVTLSRVNFTGTTGLRFFGDARDFEDVARLWYFLLNDPKLEKIELRALSRTENGTSFSFSGELILSEFTILVEE